MGCKVLIIDSIRKKHYLCGKIFDLHKTIFIAKMRAVCREINSLSCFYNIPIQIIIAETKGNNYFCNAVKRLDTKKVLCDKYATSLQ